MSRIAISGAHGTGKSTLVEQLAAVLPSHIAIEEPYYTLIDEGHTFADLPRKEDFLLLLDRSANEFSRLTSPDVIFDRCPADFLAYLIALGASADELAGSLEAVRGALDSVDLVCLLPIETPDRLPAVERPALRRRVDALLREILLDDSFGLAPHAIEVTGSLGTRVARVQTALIALQPGRMRDQRPGTSGRAST